MALKALMLRKKLNGKQAEMDALRAATAEFETREADLEKAIEESETDEERAVVEENIEAYENERKDHDSKIEALENEIRELEGQLTELEEKQERSAAPTPVETAPEEKPVAKRERDTHMITRAFGKMTTAEIRELVERDSVKAFLTEVRSAVREKRALTNVGLTVPVEFFDLLKENIQDYSKLYKHVRVKRIGGDGRQVIMGTIPEAIWTDCCANLNELSLNFNDWEFGCWKVGGYFAVCNANLEDSDIDLASELLVDLGQAIGYAVDKAIAYGTGTRMPLGIATRIVQTAAPADYPVMARPWVDLHESNAIGGISDTGVKLYQKLLTNFGNAKGKYSRGEVVHIMNEKTYSYLKAQAMSVNAAGAIVSGLEGTMPVIGGVVEVLDFVPDYNIISGYFDLYDLAERGGEKFATSEHVRFLADQTVFRGTARYDGAPVIPEGFVLQAVNGATIDTNVTFAADTAN